jgi:hypothetical protein
MLQLGSVLGSQINIIPSSRAMRKKREHFYLIFVTVSHFSANKPQQSTFSPLGFLVYPMSLP